MAAVTVILRDHLIVGGRDRMCGFCGFLNASPDARRDALEGTARRMADALAHRGPDDAGCWVDERAGVAFGHRRLAVVDLSPLGHQPMTSRSERYVVAFNGELYNFRDLRATLAGLGHTFRGHSDTEVLLAAVEQWGLRGALERFVGMFALALWDREERALMLARDRAGEKPLYYGWLGGTFAFASELKALRAHPAWRGTVSRDALAAYLGVGYVPAPASIYEGVHKLPPGAFLVVGGERPGALPQPERYWSAEEVARRGIRDPFRGTDAEATERLDALLRDAIGGQMVADVPLGAFLSGGVDSSTIAAVMQALSGRPVRTFTIGFDERAYDEAAHAKAVARHLGTEHTELYLRPRDALDVVPRLPELYDEPFADSSQIPTFLVSRMARAHVTVSLSGDGGDELFGGYNRHVVAPPMWDRVRRVPRLPRRALGRALGSVSPATLERVAAGLPARVRPPQVAGKVGKLALLLAAEGPGDVYRRLTSSWPDAHSLVRGAAPRDAAGAAARWDAVEGSFAERMMYLDLVTYLPDDILVKVDRASMGVSLETRAPFLDHRVIEFAWSLPLHLKVRGGTGKWLLRQVLDRYVPRAMIERPKSGFAVPVAEWLRGPLRDWAESLLDPRSLDEGGYLHAAPIVARWREHAAGVRDWHASLWSVLMFESWRKHQAPPAGQR